MVSLLDINILVALAWPNHTHHGLAMRWFQEHRASGWAACPVTQSGFVRISSNQRILPEARSPREAFLLLEQMTSLDGHVFWNDDVDLSRSSLVAKEKIRGHRQVTDAHLLAIAIRYSGRLATIDKGLLSIVPPKFSARQVVCVVAGNEDDLRTPL